MSWLCNECSSRQLKWNEVFLHDCSEFARLVGVTVAASTHYFSSPDLLFCC